MGRRLKPQILAVFIAFSVVVLIAIVGGVVLMLGNQRKAEEAALLEEQASALSCTSDISRIQENSSMFRYNGSYVANIEGENMVMVAYSMLTQDGVDICPPKALYTIPRGTSYTLDEEGRFYLTQTDRIEIYEVEEQIFGAKITISSLDTKLFESELTEITTKTFDDSFFQGDSLDSLALQSSPYALALVVRAGDVTCPENCLEYMEELKVSGMGVWLYMFEDDEFVLVKNYEKNDILEVRYPFVQFISADHMYMGTPVNAVDYRYEIYDISTGILTELD